MSDERTPVRTLEDLYSLDHIEILEGYMDGLENFPAGENRSRSYWHGWRNGMMDKGHMPHDEASAELARLVVAASAKLASASPSTGDHG